MRVAMPPPLHFPLHARDTRMPSCPRERLFVIPLPTPPGLLQGARRPSRYQARVGGVVHGHVGDVHHDVLHACGQGDHLSIRQSAPGVAVCSGAFLVKCVASFWSGGMMKRDDVRRAAHQRDGSRVRNANGLHTSAAHLKSSFFDGAGAGTSLALPCICALEG